VTGQCLVHPVQDGFEERLARREVAVHRGVADARPAGDVVQRRVDPCLGEDRGGGRHEALAVAPCVSAPWR
jgi:hypothetical protein